MVQISTLNVIIVGLMMVIFGFFWRMLSAHWHDNTIGQAMSVAI